MKLNISNKKQKFQVQAENLKKLMQPKGAFQSQRAKTESIDVELREVYKREEEFNRKIKNELAKLNFPLTEIPISRKKAKRPTTSFEYSLVTPLKPQLLSPRSPITPQIVPKTPNSPVTNRPRKRFNSSLGFSSYINTKKLATQALPALIKSVPIHQDPNFKFTKIKKPKKNDFKYSSRISNMNLILNKLNSVDNLDNKVINKIVKKTSRMSKSVHDCINTLCESEKFGLGISLSTIVNQQKDAMKLTEFILNETNHATTELNQTVSQVLSKSKRGRYSSLGL